MFQPYTLGFNTTVIDGGNIATSTIRAQSMYSGSVDAWKINTQHLAAGSITASLLAVGPQFQFRTTAGGQQMTVNQDGSLSLPSSGRNPSDARWVADNTRSYSGAQLVKTFAATFSGGSTGRGIIFNLVDPFATSGQRGILVWLDGGVGVYTCSGVGVYGLLGDYNPGFNTLSYPTRLVIQHYANQSNPRMRVFVNGTEVNPGGFTDAYLGGTSNGVQGGCAGFLLTDNTIKVSEIVMGNQTVILEDGRVQAQHIDAVSIGASQLIISNIVGGINNGSTTINGGKITTNTITADHINVASINASSAWIDSLDARIIKARTIKASMIEARAYNFINNFSVTGTTADWSPAGTIETVARGAVNVRAMKIATAGDVQVLSSSFEIDPTKSYQTKLSFLVGREAVGGLVYFGLYAYDKDGAEVPLEYLTDSGTWATLGTNCYWFHQTNPCDGSWHDLTGFLMAHDTQPQDAPPPPIAGQLNPYVAVNGVLVNAYQDRAPILRMPPNAVSIRIRFLNFYNSGVSRSVWFANPSVSEVGTGVINADNIRAGALESYGNGTTGRYATATVANNGNASIAYTGPSGFRISSVPFPVYLRPALNKDLNATYMTARQVDVMAEFGGNVSLGGYMIGEITARTLNALDAPPMDAPGSTTGPWYTGAARIFYRGNNSPGTLGGAPNIACLSIQVTKMDVTYDEAVYRFKIKPINGPTDNLDAMRFLKVEFWSSNTKTLYMTHYFPVSDRLYASATDSDDANATYVSFPWNSESNWCAYNNGDPTFYLKCTLYNAYGPSADNWFIPASSLDTDFTNNGTPVPDALSGGGATGGVPGGGGGGGGGTGGGCLPAGSPFLSYVDGQVVHVPIETLRVNDYAVGYDDQTLQPVISKVTRTFVYRDRDLYQVVTTGGNLVCSHDHRLALVSDSGSVSYPPARDLRSGARIYWFNPRNGSLEPVEVLSSTPTGTCADVYHLTLEKGHVYIGAGFPAHNFDKMPIDMRT